MRWFRVALFAVVCITTTGAASVLAQPFPTDPGDWGDAPEGGAAYPAAGTPGQFPTCRGGASGFIYHHANMLNANSYFGLSVDFELDGNAGQCAPPPYEQDECFGLADADAGLTVPVAYTYGPTNQLITCSGRPGGVLGQPCGQVHWGSDIDILISNNTGNIAFFNVIMDLDHSGDWSAFPVGPFCGPQIPEHVVKNLPVPINFHGLASQLPNAPFIAGPDTGLVWGRFTISEQPVPAFWTGGGWFDSGETEDYLFRIAADDAAEYGDAPEGAPAYPPAATIGNFPTCIAAGSYVVHHANPLICLGSAVTTETNGNHGVCSFPQYDRDECSGAGTGLIRPLAYTISAANAIVACASAHAVSLGRACELVQYGTNLDVEIHNGLPATAYFNLLVDWDHDGRWSGTFPSCPISAVIAEHSIVNLAVPPGFSGLLSQLNPAQFHLGGRGFAWARSTVSELPAPADWDGSGNMGDGETEDYLLLVDGAPTDTEGSLPRSLHISEAAPNPAHGSTGIDLALPAASEVFLSVYDAAGHRIRRPQGQLLSRGSQRLQWDGRSDSGRPASTGAYFLRVTVAGQTVSRRVFLLR